MRAGRKKGSDHPCAHLAPALGRRLRRAREDRNTTRDKLGSDAGIAVSTIAKLESGRITEPGFFTVWVICRALSYDFEDLFKGLESDQP
jgi:transcriptional regulator with XRE-family HTH domain